MPRFVVFFALVLFACDPAPLVHDREIGDRTPLTRACDDVDPTRCLLPWPSNAFTTADPTTPTGIHLEVDLATLNRDDDGTLLARADGFSRVSTILAGFPAEIDPATLQDGVHLYLAQHDHPDRGREIPLELRVVLEDGEEASLVVGQPLAPLEAGADHVVVITSSLLDVTGAPAVASRGTELAMGLAAPTTQEEADLVGYHAPTRAFVEEQGIAPEEVVRAWDFTTRSAEDPLRRLRAMRAATIAAVDGGDAEVVIDGVEHRDTGAIASIVTGRLAGLPDFREPLIGIAIDAQGMPRATGEHDAPFRIVVPRGTGDYRVLMYGHGTGGTVGDASFDEAIAAEGAAKVGIEFYGWTETTVIDTFVGLVRLATGASAASSGLVQAIADGAAIRHALSGPLGDALAADTLGGMPNPHAGRRPDDSIPIWVGGSLGGTMGLVFAASDPGVRHAVLNVPGAAWGTWVPDAAQFGLIQPLLARANGGDLNLRIGVAVAQTFLDEADGASWVDELEADPVIALVQESIGDPVLPNPGTHVVARVLGASQIGEVLVPVEGVETATEARGRSALTQYRVLGDELDVHGFAARDTPAAAAAQEQIFQFVTSTWAGEPLVTVPSGCAAASCDFTR